MTSHNETTPDSRLDALRRDLETSRKHRFPNCADTLGMLIGLAHHAAKEGRFALVGGAMFGQYDYSGGKARLPPLGRK